MLTLSDITSHFFIIIIISIESSSSLVLNAEFVGLLILYFSPKFRMLKSDGSFVILSDREINAVGSCHPDEGGAKLLRNVGSYKSHTAQHPRRHHSSYSPP
jgi:hypothetical protein